MHLTITGGSLPLARQLAEAAAGSHTVRVVSDQPLTGLSGGITGHAGDVRDPEVAAAALAGAEVLVHLAPLGTEGAALDVLDRASRGTFVLMNAARKAGVSRVVVGSTLALFRALPRHWRVGEGWRPRPQPVTEQIAPWLAELSTREFARGVGGGTFTCVRLGESGASANDPAWLDPQDALAGLRRAVEFEPTAPGWHLYHLTSGGPWLHQAAREPFSFAPQGQRPGNAAKVPRPDPDRWEDWRAALAPRDPIRSRPIRRVVIFGAGGPIGATAARLLAPAYRLRVTDVRPIEEIHRAGARQSPNAPLPEPLPPPHEMTVVDVTDPQQVLAACEGMDAIVNCTVIRRDPVEAFRVNTLGAYNIAQAAVAHRIRRVVQTGPQLVSLQHGQGYGEDYDVPGDAPPRPADHLYGHSKYLGQEVLRVFADAHDLEVPVLLYCNFVNPAADEREHGIGPFTTSWDDAGHSIRRALEVERFPSAYEVMNINADLPHGKYSIQRAKDLLGWQPLDGLERYWVGE